MSLKLLYGKDLGFKTKYIQELSELVSKKTGLDIPYNKPIVGKNVFRHESGIHVDAVIEEPLTYEPYLPELVGQKRQLVLGKHSGCRAVKAKLAERFGITQAVKIQNFTTEEYLRQIGVFNFLFEFFESKS